MFAGAELRIFGWRSDTRKAHWRFSRLHGVLGLDRARTQDNADSLRPRRKFIADVKIQTHTKPLSQTAPLATTGSSGAVR